MDIEALETAFEQLTLALGRVRNADKALQESESEKTEDVRGEIHVAEGAVRRAMQAVKDRAFPI